MYTIHDLSYIYVLIRLVYYCIKHIPIYMRILIIISSLKVSNYSVPNAVMRNGNATHKKMNKAWFLFLRCA